MVSGVSFKNPAVQNKRKRNRKFASAGILTSFLLVLIVGASYAGAWYYERVVSAKSAALHADIANTQSTISAALQGPPAEFITKYHIVDNHLFREASTDRVLSEIENMMVDRVVLTSLHHNFDKREESYIVTLEGDAENLDVLASQIDTWKKSDMYSRVYLESTSRNDENRVVFNVVITLSSSGYGPFENIPNGEVL